MSADWGEIAHHAAVARIEALYEAELGDGEYPEDVADPFCGCLDCLVRETLHAAFPILSAAIEAELRGEDPC